MTVAEPGPLAPESGSTAFVTLHSGAHDDVAVQPSAPSANVLESAGPSAVDAPA
jgi:hypothetical protein